MTLVAAQLRPLGGLSGAICAPAPAQIAPKPRRLGIWLSTGGHRLLRGGVYPGGARATWLPQASTLAAIHDDIHDVVEFMMANATVVDRFTGTAVLSTDDAAQIGTLG